MIGGTAELDKYILKSAGITRRGLNIECLLGLFFPFLTAMALESLGKNLIGWLYLNACIGIGLVAINTGSPGLIPLAVIPLALAWMHANRVLTRYESQARRRIQEIDSVPSGRTTADMLLEKALLQHRVLGQVEAATQTIGAVHGGSGGDPDLLYRGGIILSAQKRFEEARHLFERALPLASDTGLKKRINKNTDAISKIRTVQSPGGQPVPSAAGGKFA